MDEDTQPPEEPMHPEDDQSQFARISREVKKDEQRMKALTRRMGGHPYDRTDMIPTKVRREWSVACVFVLLEGSLL